jgi:nuclear transport factor 2 (NTF2) superfamily protein
MAAIAKETAAAEWLRQVYEDFNARRMDAVLARLDPEVEWANGMEGGHVHGRDGVRAYWTRQWQTIDPHVDPVSIEKDAKERWIVEVHQLVRDLEGKILAERTVHHAYRIEDGLIQRMDIE